MLHHLPKVQENLLNILKQFHYQSGQSIGWLTSLSSQDQGDESSLTTFTVQVILHENEEDYPILEQFNNAMRNMNPNELLALEPDMQLPFKREIDYQFLTAWRTPNADTFMIQETDATFYIIIIDSGQY